MVQRRPLVQLLLVGLLLAAGSASTAAAALERRELRVGVATDEPPFAYLGDDGQFHGFTADVARVLCRRLQVRCTLVPVDTLDPVAPLQSRAVDLIPAVAMTAERRGMVDFTDRYFRAPARFVMPRGRGLDVSPEALNGKAIGVQRGTTQDRYATATYPGSVLRRYPDRAELFIDLALGRLDAVLTNVISGRTEFLDTELGAEFEFAGPVLDDPAWFGEGIGIAVRKGDEQLRAALNDALRQIRADGNLDAIRSRYVGFPID